MEKILPTYINHFGFAEVPEFPVEQGRVQRLIMDSTGISVKQHMVPGASHRTAGG
jgi:hypothetical protein